MRRKLIRQGSSTLTVSLPKGWAASNSLSAGDEVEVSAAGKELRLSAGAARGRRAVSIDVSSLPTVLVRATLNAHYIRGEEELRVKCAKSQHATIHSTVDNLVGMAVVEQQPSLCVVRDVTSPGDVEVSALIRRIYRMALDLAEECHADIELMASGKAALTTAEQAAERDVGINRIVNFTLRHLSRQASLDAREASACFHLVLLLELVADEYTNLWKDILAPGVEIGKPALALYRQALSMTRTCFTLLYRYDAAEAAAVSHTKAIVRGQAAEETDLPPALAFHLRKIAELSVNLLQAQLLLSL